MNVLLLWVIPVLLCLWFDWGQGLCVMCSVQRSWFGRYLRNAIAKSSYIPSLRQLDTHPLLWLFKRLFGRNGFFPSGNREDKWWFCWQQREGELRLYIDDILLAHHGKQGRYLGEKLLKADGNSVADGFGVLPWHIILLKMTLHSFCLIFMWRALDQVVFWHQSALVIATRKFGAFPCISFLCWLLTVGE